MEEIQFNGVRVEVKRKAFQRKLGVTVHPNGRVLVSANKTLSQREILSFLTNNTQWLENTLAQSQKLRDRYPIKRFQAGEYYPYLGGEYRLRINQGESLGLKFQGAEILFTSPRPECQWSEEQRQKYLKLLIETYKKVAKSLMSQRLRYYSQKMGLIPQGVSFRGQKTIWGSCSPENKISLNYKLIVAPIQVVDYVLIHELAHIRHKNHSKSFWKLVDQYTDHRQYSKVWLREHHYRSDFLNVRPELHL